MLEQLEGGAHMLSIRDWLALQMITPIFDRYSLKQELGEPGSFRVEERG